jgi:aminopeptidase N
MNVSDYSPGFAAFNIACLSYWLLALILAGVMVTPAVAQQAPSEEVLPQLTRMELAVELDYEAERIAGTATLTLKNASDAPLSRVPLLLNRLMRVTVVHTDDGQDLKFRQRVTSYEDWETFQINAIEVDLATPLLPGESTPLEVDFEGHLVGYTETGMLYVRDHVSRDFTILREDARAFPLVGVPSHEANRAAPRASFEFEVWATVPEDLVVATGGEEIGRTVSDGMVTWHYRSREPAPYLIVTIAPYLVASEDGLRIFHFPEDSAGARAMLDASRQAAARYQEIFGPLDRPLALTIMEIPDGWGSQASLAGGIIQVAGAFRDSDRMQELYHELSHLWNAVDLDARSPRWNEGLAMFLQGRLAREIDGWDGESAALDRTAARLLERCGSGEPCGSVPLRHYGDEELTDYSYSVGRLMFAALYEALGEEAFDRALHKHFQMFQASGAYTDDMVRAFVDEGGPVAQRIFDDWLEFTAWLDRRCSTGWGFPAVGSLDRICGSTTRPWR